MMKRDDLKKLLGESATDEVLDSIMALHGKDLTKSQTAAETAQTEAGAYKTQLEEANKQIEDFKKLDPQKIQATADDYKAKFEQAQKDAAAQVASVKQAHALERDLKEKYKVKPNEVKSLIVHIDMDALKYDEKKDTFVGLEEQIKPLSEAHESLFESTDPAPKTVIGGRSQSAGKETTLADAIGQKLGLQGK